MEYNLSKVRQLINALRLTPSDIGRAIDEADSTQVLRYAGIEVFFYLRTIKVARPPYSLMVIASPKGNTLYVDVALKVYHSLGLDLEQSTPVNILRQMAERFGYVVTIGPKTGKFFLQETLPLANLLPNDKFVMAIDFKKSQSLLQIAYYRVERLSPPVVHYAIALYLDEDQYQTWIGRKGKPTAFEIEASLIREFAEHQVAPALTGKPFRDKVYLLAHDFCFYCRERPRSLGKLTEEDIRDLFLIAVKTALKSGEAEAFHHDGRLDFKIVNPDNKYEVYAGEFKWWRGMLSAKELFHQAVRKHSTGQEAAIFTIVLSKNRNAKNVFSELLTSFQSETEYVPRSSRTLVLDGSKELFEECFVDHRGNQVKLILGLADLFHENV